MATRIVYRDLVPDLILVSPAERAWATAEIVAEACELDAKQVQCARELYLAAPETLWRLLRRRDGRRGHVLICGHNPGLSQIATRLGPKTQAARPAHGGTCHGAMAWRRVDHARAGNRDILRTGRSGKHGRPLGLGRVARGGI